MGEFTKWLASVRLDSAAGLSDAAKETLWGEVFRRVRSAMRRFEDPWKFGSADADDLAKVRILWFLGRAAAGTLPEHVTDRDRVASWLIREGWSRCCRDLKRAADQQKSTVRGPSVLAGGDPAEAAGDPMDGLSSDGRDRATPHFEEADADALVRDVLETARADLLAWRSAREVEAFNRHVFGGEELRPIAAHFGVAHPTVYDWVQRGKFCVARRLGWTAEALATEFGEEESRRWAAVLDRSGDQRKGV